MVEVSLTVGKLDASLALLLTKDHHLIEFPTILLPDGISSGSIVKINCERDLKKEKEEKEQFSKLQEEIFDTFGKHEPKDPILKIVNITQTSCVLEWEPLNLGTAELKSLTLYKNGSKLGPIKNPFQKKNIKFSGLPVDTPYKFQLKMETTSGIYHSNTIELKTHKMTDLSGITICIGDIDYSKEKFTLKDIEEAIGSIGAKPYSTTVKVDTTQFICTEPKGIEYEKAKNMNIPLIRPEWLKACELERRIVGVNKFYVESEDPIWQHKDFWKPIDSPKHSETLPVPIVEESKSEENAVPVPIIQETKPEEPIEETPEHVKPEEPIEETPEHVKPEEPIEEVPGQTKPEEPTEENPEQVKAEEPIEEALEQVTDVKEEVTSELEPEESVIEIQTTESKKEEPASEETQAEPKATFTEEAIAEETKIADPVEEKKPEESVPVLSTEDDKQKAIEPSFESNIEEVNPVSEQEFKTADLSQSTETEPKEAEIESTGKSLEASEADGNDEAAHANGDKEEEEEEPEELENGETEVETPAESKPNSASSNKSKNKKKNKKKGKK